MSKYLMPFLCLCKTGLSTLTHNTAAQQWTPSVSADQGSSLAQQVGHVMPHSTAFLLGSGSATDPESSLLLDTNLQVRCSYLMGQFWRSCCTRNVGMLLETKPGHLNIMCMSA